MNPEGTLSPSQDQNQNNNQNQGQDSQIQPAEQAPVFDAETEDGFHEHSLNSYSQLSHYYEELRNGYYDLYADWAAGKGTSARCGSA